MEHTHATNNLFSTTSLISFRNIEGKKIKIRMGIDAVKKTQRSDLMNLDFGSSHSKLTIENFFAGGGFGGNTKKKETDNPDWISLRNIQKVNLNVLIQIIAPIIERQAVDHLVLGRNPPELTLMDTGGHRTPFIGAHTHTKCFCVRNWSGWSTPDCDS